MRDETLERLHYIIQVLEAAYPGKLTYYELAERVEEITRDRRPAKRTLIRDVERLRRQGFDIHTVQQGRYMKLSLSPDQEKQTAPISDIQLLALSLAQELLEPLRGTVFWNGIRAFWNTTMRAAPESTQRHFRRRRQQVIVRGTPTKSYADKGGILSTLFDAQLSHREVEIRYMKAGPLEGDAAPRTVRPYSMAFYQGSIFIVAEDAAKDDVRTFKLDRITSAKRLDTFFKPRPNFDPRDYFQHSLSVYAGGSEKPKRMTLRVDRAVAAHVAEQPWRPDQTLERLDDGDYRLVLPSVFESEVIAKTLGYKGQIEILTPKSARKKLAETAKKIVKMHG